MNMEPVTLLYNREWMHVMLIFQYEGELIAVLFLSYIYIYIYISLY
jgi:hypothetical protein